MSSPVVVPLDTPNLSLALAGGKGANLARLVTAHFPVPPGFVVTTPAYQAFVAENGLAEAVQSALRELSPTDPAALEAASSTIRSQFEQGTMPEPIRAALHEAYAALGSPPVAVRSSATAEDLPEMSFAGQQDTFLNVRDEAALMAAVVRCWSSLWTARAIGYRARNHIPHDEVALAVVVQEMVPSKASGVLFTANPLTGKRDESAVDATLGLGEALVSGLVEPDHYLVDAASGRIVIRTLGSKAVATREQAGGGVVTVAEDAAARQAIPDEAILALARLGNDVATLFGSPQDIEWGWANGKLSLLQSRPITSLYPIPERATAHPPTILVSFGAIQGMLDPMTPLGQESIAGVFAGIGAAFGFGSTRQSQMVIHEAGERLWVNISTLLRNRILRRVIRRGLPSIEPSVAQVLEPLWDEPLLAPTTGRPSLETARRLAPMVTTMLGNFLISLLRPDASRKQAQRGLDKLVAEAERRGQQASNLNDWLNLYDFVMAHTFPIVVPLIMPRVLAGMLPLALVNRLAEALPDGNRLVLGVLRGLPHNVTTEMDLQLWETARTIKGDPTSATSLAEAEASNLAAAYLAGTLPPVAQRAVASFLNRYGMRGLAEIDMGRPRWREEPTAVFQTLKSYLRIDEPEQAPDAVFSRGEAAAAEDIESLAQAMEPGPRGGLKAALVRAATHRTRALAGLRESPKFLIIRLFGIVRAGLLAQGQALVAQGRLTQPDDLFFLRVEELRALAMGSQREWKPLIAERRQRYARELERRQVPRLLFGDGQSFYEGVTAPEGLEEGVIVGSPVSPGVAEGVVRVVFDPTQTALLPGEILVCPGTDPAWTPLFLAAGGLVMEVGGLMTHGSVVAREYGIPAVVGVHEATTRLRTGQRVRVDGSAGRVVVLEEEETAEATD